MDLAKVANTVLFVSSAVNELDKSQRNEVLDSWGEEIIQTVISQGLATPIVALTNIESLPVKVLYLCSLSIIKIRIKMYLLVFFLI